MTEAIVLQACGMDPWLAGEFGRCIIDPVRNLIGNGLFGLFIAAAVWGGLYFAGGGNSTTATTVTILLATALFPVLPGQYTGIAWSVLVIGAAAAILQAGQKYVLSPATQ